MDRQAAQRAIEAFLAALGYPAEGQLADTPRLVMEAWADELLTGHSLDPAEILRSASLPRGSQAREWVTLRDLDVVTMCPHHLLPAHGRADVVYRPGPQLVGFGAVAKALDALSRRLTLQESVGRALTALLVDELHAVGAACRLRMTHTCLVVRGARQHSAQIETLALAGSCDRGADGEMALTILAAGAGR